MFKAVFFCLCLLTLGCGSPDNRPQVEITGTEVSCWDSKGMLAVETTDGVVVNLDVLSGMPLCGSFAKGGVWEIHFHKAREDYNYLVIDFVRRVSAR